VKFTRRHDLGNQIEVYKLVDTCAANLKAKTPYIHAPFERRKDESVVLTKRKIVVLRSDKPYRNQGSNLLLLVFMAS